VLGTAEHVHHPAKLAANASRNNQKFMRCRKDTVKRLLSDTEREAETKLRKLGVRISRDDSGEVYMAQVNGPQCNDDVVAHLEELSWSNTASSRKVGRWATWTFPILGLDNTRITDDGFARLTSLTGFRFIGIQDNLAITDSALEHLKHCPQLRGLRISGTSFTGDGIVYLKELKNLVYFSMRFTAGMTDDGVESLKELTNLEGLELGGKEITDARIKHITSLRNLTELDVEGSLTSGNETPITDDGVKHVSSLKNLRVLHLRRLGLSDIAVKHLKSLTGLERLRLSGNQISDAGLANLKNMVHVKQLELSNNQLTDSGLTYLKTLTDIPTAKAPKPFSQKAFDRRRLK
jgi:Leucine-rich repeat (LRR) protein